MSRTEDEQPKQEWEIEIEPVNDLRPHIASVFCSCNPKLEDRILIHNAFDGRDRRERYDAQFKSDQ